MSGVLKEIRSNAVTTAKLFVGKTSGYVGET